MSSVSTGGQIIPGTGFHAFFAITFTLRGNGNDRQVLARLYLADLANGVDTVDFGHHDVHQHDVDVGTRLQITDRIASVVVGDDAHPAPEQ
jgi:hypothetical protein